MCDWLLRDRHLSNWCLSDKFPNIAGSDKCYRQTLVGQMFQSNIQKQTLVGQMSVGQMLFVKTVSISLQFGVYRHALPNMPGWLNNVCVIDFSAIVICPTDVCWTNVPTWLGLTNVTDKHWLDKYFSQTFRNKRWLDKCQSDKCCLSKPSQ